MRCGLATTSQPQAARQPYGLLPPWRGVAAGQQARRPAARPAAGPTPTESSVDDSTEWVDSNRSGTHCGKLLPVRPELAAELRPLAALANVADTAELSRRVAALGPKPERRVLEHGFAVAQLLLGLGLPRTQLAALLHRCPLLFSWPANERAALLFGQLAQLGLTAVEAARCFEQQSTAAAVPSFEPAIAVLAELFAAGSKSGSSRSGEQLLGDLLRRQSAAVGLLCSQPTILQQRISNLVQRYGPHWEEANKQAVIVAALQRRCWALLNLNPAHLLAVEAVLQEDLGQQPGDSTHLLATILQRHALAASCSPDTLQARVQALKAEFGQDRLLQAGPESLAELLAVDTATWQRALAVWQLLGVADPAALALNSTRSLTPNWLTADRLASLVALQQLLPWQPSTADAVQFCSNYIVNSAPPRLIGRLLFQQQEGVLPLLVADKVAARQQWRRQHGLPANKRAGDEPQLISLRDVAREPDAALCSLLAQVVRQHRQAELQGCDSKSSSGGSSMAERYHAFMAQLPQLPAYQRLLAAGQARVQWLRERLPPELLSEPARWRVKHTGKLPFVADNL